ncbi:CBO0543 family protein [Ornithinibacillus californiensis]|uniref:CBO0543 family protein n=1 Tax=Ornithinibacillus californiensis TaxID=161536 RepID=UPI00064D8384|nr:CBO0543 family protein [Ornithinibacillus californiensis]
MNIEHTILYSYYAAAFISLRFIPRDKWREASVIFLSQQFVTWFFGLLVVELHLIEYPVRELAEVNKTSFLFEFLAFPIITIFFCIYFPQAAVAWKKVLYTSAFCTGLTIFEVVFVKYTLLISYIRWDWYVTWVSVYAALSLSYFFYKWYFKIKAE